MTLQYCGGFCHTLTWISQGCIHVCHPERPLHPAGLPEAQRCPGSRLHYGLGEKTVFHRRRPSGMSLAREATRVVHAVTLWVLRWMWKARWQSLPTAGRVGRDLKQQLSLCYQSPSARYRTGRRPCRQRLQSRGTRCTRRWGPDLACEVAEFPPHPLIIQSESLFPPHSRKSFLQKLPERLLHRSVSKGRTSF